MKTLGDLGAGNTLGRYELLLPIARGGMAMVWAARIKGTRGFQKLVAIKSMLPSLGEDDQFEKMFLEEAELASRIKHPSCCQILDLGEEDGALYLVMELIHGEPLSALQKAAGAAGGVPLGVALEIVHAAALGLHAAHELRDDAGELLELVHRDVSPQNILVTFDGQVKIVDFGIAKVASAGAGRTQAGQVKGKVPYMAPEQCAQRKVDRRTDVFALGIVLYHLVTGKHPFRGDDDMATLRNICTSAPVERAYRIAPETPPEVDAILAKALEKSAARRYSTMLEFAEALGGALATLPPDARGRESAIGPFMQRVLGDRAEKKRLAIKDAIRVADQRALARDAGVASLERPLPSELSDVGAGSSPSAPISAAVAADVPREERVDEPVAPASVGSASAVVSDAPAPPRGSRRSVAIAAAALVSLVAGTVALLTLRASDPTSAGGSRAPSASDSASPAGDVVSTAAQTPIAAATGARAVEADSAAPVGDALAAPPPSKKPLARAKGAAASSAPSAKPSATAAATSTGPAVTGPRILDPGF